MTAWGDMRLVGIPVADALFYTLHTVVLLVILRRRRGGLDGRRVLSTLSRVAVASIAGGAVAWGVTYLTPALGASRLGFMLQLLGGGVLGLGTAYGLAALMRVDELHDGAAMIRRVLERIRPKPAVS
jgi:putative peptidoglycan lipid II flippase